MTITARTRRLAATLLAFALSLAIFSPGAAHAQLYGRPIAQPFFDFPTWARFSNCRPGPFWWQYEVFPNYGPVDCACAACNAPPSVACPGDFVAHRPSSWYGSADFAPLTYDNGREFEFARIGPTGPTALGTGDLQPEFDAGGKFTIGRKIFGCSRIEGTYLGLYDYDDTAVITNNDDNTLTPATVGNLSTFLSGFNDPELDTFDGANLARIRFQSSLQGAEINYLHWCDMPPGPFDVTVLVGARYLRINEQFDFFSQSNSPAGGSSNDVQTNTQNDLWGVQLGIGGAWLVTTRWWFDFTIKGAMLNDHIQLDNSFHQVINGADTTTDTSATANRTAWLGDVSVMGNFQFLPRWTLRVGYQALFLNGVALAADNMAENAILFGTPNVNLNDSGRLTYHGPVLGVTWMR